MRFGGIVLAVLWALGACTSDPVPLEPKSPATSSATPTISPPTMPPQARKDSTEGAAAFVKHYIDIFNYAASTGDVKELSRLSSPKCDGCQSYIDLYRDTYQAGGYFKDDGWVVSTVNAVSLRRGYVVDFSVRAPETTYRTTRHSPVKLGKSDSYLLRLKMADGIVLGLAEVES